jgi:pyrroline-5-carboxylate reductase
MKEANLTFIGSGNMARSLVGGLIADGCEPERIRMTDPDSGKRDQLGQTFGVRMETDNVAAVAGADALILAVKPQVVRAVASELAGAVAKHRPLVISIAAGIRESDLRRWLGGEAAIVRAMPNTPALVQSGATALFANAGVSAEQQDLAESILRAVGLTLWLDQEDQMDAVTALSGSGPAYFFLMIEALEQAGTRLGLPAETARLLALQTAFGAARMALESEEGVDRLRARVTSPGGTTERAIEVLEKEGLRDLMAHALAAAWTRSRELAEELGKD